jgi:glucose/arabinose dehydrogenase
MVIRPKALSVVLLLAAVSFAGAPVAAVPTPGTLVQLVPFIPSGLSSPIGLTHAGDGSGRLFIVEQTGQIRIRDGNQLLATPFLNLSSLTSACHPTDGCGERGLLGLAFHPGYETNGFFYVFYTRASDGDIVVARYQNPEPADNVANAGSGTTLLIIEHTSAGNHNGGQIAFGPDGYLYIATGDGGGSGDPAENGLNINSLLGKILRIDVDGDDFPGDPARNYAIPASNPFAGGTPGADEIWAFGLRNPWRFSFDRLTGDLYIGDVGQGTWEEIDFQRASSTGGENYGWDVLEGAHCFEDVPAGACNTFLNGGSELPILEYNQTVSGHCAVTGGFVFRNLPSHSTYGDYAYGDFCSGHIWRGHEGSPGVWASPLLFDTSLSISSFGENESGRLYVVNLGGSVQWLAPYTFSDVTPGFWAWPFIEAIYGAEITAGCTAGSPPAYCPGDLVTRAQMAIFLLKGIHGPAYQPPPAQGNVFADVQAGDFAAAWIEQLFAEGITAGCGGGNYCPNDTATRAEMAIFLLRSKHGSAYTPPAAPSSFSDVPNDSFAQDWIEELFDEGITGGCDTNPLRYCPGNPVSRAEMAAFLSRTFALPLP